MRARFTDCIASTEGWSYGVGAEVRLAGDRYTADTVPMSVGQVWLSTGLLEPVGVSTELATASPSRTAAGTTAPTNAPPRGPQKSAFRR